MIIAWMPALAKPGQISDASTCCSAPAVLQEQPWSVLNESTAGSTPGDLTTLPQVVGLSQVCCTLSHTPLALGAAQLLEVVLAAANAEAPHALVEVRGHEVVALDIDGLGLLVAQPP